MQTNNKIPLNKIGKDYAERVKTQLDEMNLLIPGDTEIMLYDLGIQYQQYQKYLILAENSLNAKDTNSYLVISNRFYNNVLNIQKSMGLTVMSRTKLKVLENADPVEESVIDRISQYLSE
jgi:hypothetical protein